MAINPNSNDVRRGEEERKARQQQLRGERGGVQETPRGRRTATLTDLQPPGEGKE